MNKNLFGKVAVLMGGTSSEREVSIQSGQAVVAALQSKDIECEAIDCVKDFADKLMHRDFTRAFIALHGKQGEDGTIQGFLETIGMPYTGSRVLGSAISMDKARTKRIWQSLGLATSPFIICPKDTSDMTGNLDWIKSVGFPVCVKPVFEGSSIGVTKVNKVSELQDACELASNYGQVMLEQWLIGEEYTVAIVGNQAMPSVCIVAEDGFYDFNSKYISEKTQYLCPSPLSNVEEKQLQRLALQAYNAVGASGWGRVDFIRDLNGDFWLLEVNTVPGLTSHSLVPIAARTAGLEFEDLILEILSQTLNQQAVYDSSGLGRGLGADLTHD